MSMSARIFALFILATLLLGAGASLSLHFNGFHIDHRVQLAAGLVLVSLFIVLSMRLAHYQQSLAQAKKNLDEAQQLAALGSWERDLNTGRGYWSENHYRLFGMQPGETAPSLDEFFALIHGDDREQARDTVMAAIRTGSGYEISYRLANDGSSRVFLSRGKVLLDDNRKPVTVVGTLQDVTEKHTQERLREALIKQKDMFITRLGHDLKTPLTPLVALLPLIRSRTSDDKQRELVDICINNASHIKDLVSKTIKVARLSSPAQPLLNLVDIGLAAAVDEFVSIMAVADLGHGTVIENLIKPGIVVQADMHELEVVFLNLIGNALKFSPPGSLVSVDAVSENGLVTSSVRDNGIGLAPAEEIHIFDEFYKVDPSRHDLGSSGLGLTICRQIVEHHGGRIWAESPGLGKGTAIYFTLAAGGIA